MLKKNTWRDSDVCLSVRLYVTGNFFFNIPYFLPQFLFYLLILFLTSSNCLTASPVTHTVASARSDSALIELLLLSMMAVSRALGTPQSTKGSSVISFRILEHFSWMLGSGASLSMARCPMEVSVLLRIRSDGGSSIIETKV